MKSEDAEAFKIYIDRLREGKRERLSQDFSASFLEINEDELAFNLPISVEGEVYLTENMLLFHFFSIKTEATMPCAICNREVNVPLLITDLYHTVDVDTVKGRCFLFNDLLREAILIELPHTAECSNGHCPAREEMAKYLNR